MNKVSKNQKPGPDEPERRNPEQFLNTDDLQESLKERSVQGGAFTVGAEGMKFVLQLGSTAVLARLLMPEHFGLLGMVVAVTGFVRMFKEAGLSIATVQREDITHEQVSTLFWLNAALSLGVAAVIAALSPAIAWFYGEPRLAGITLALAVVAFITGFGIQHNALLRRRMRFGRLAAIEVGSMAVGIAAAILAAWLGAGYWALVLNMAVKRVIGTTARWVACGWRPGWPVRGSGVRELIAFGGNLTGGRVMNYAVRHVDDILLGVVWGPAALGFYQKAYGLLMQPIRRFNGPIGAVAVPALSRLQNQPEKFRETFVQAIRLVSAVSVPIVIFSLLDADHIVGLMLGSKWKPSIPIFRAMAPGAFSSALNVASGWVLLPLGLGEKQLRVSVYGGFVMIAAFVVGANWGALGMAVGFSCGVCLKRIPQLAYIYHGTSVRLRDLGRAIWIAALAAFVAASGVYLTSLLMRPGVHIYQLIVDGVVFGMIYAGIWALIPTGREYIRLMVSLALRSFPRFQSCVEWALPTWVR